MFGNVLGIASFCSIARAPELQRRVGAAVAAPGPYRRSPEPRLEFGTVAESRVGLSNLPGFTQIERLKKKQRSDRPSIEGDGNQLT